ncbi:hypothetical protein LQT61_00735 (plasmid) [Escherichia coli]|nr:hypothetical protein LQT61_00735 [Escherichia coli]
MVSIFFPGIFNNGARFSRCCGTLHHRLWGGCDSEGAAGREQIYQALAADNLHPFTGNTDRF